MSGFAQHISICVSVLRSLCRHVLLLELVRFLCVEGLRQLIAQGCQVVEDKIPDIPSPPSLLFPCPFSPSITVCSRPLPSPYSQPSQLFPTLSLPSFSLVMARRFGEVLQLPQTHYGAVQNLPICYSIICLHHQRSMQQPKSLSLMLSRFAAVVSETETTMQNCFRKKLPATTFPVMSRCFSRAVSLISGLSGSFPDTWQPCTSHVTLDINRVYQH